MYMAATYARDIHDVTDLVEMAVLTAAFLQVSNVNFFFLKRP